MSDPSDRSELSAAEATSGSEALHCSNCGRELEAGFTFCDGCGTPVDSSARVEPRPPAGSTEAKDSEQANAEPQEGGRRFGIGGWLRRVADDRQRVREEEEPPPATEEIVPPRQAPPAPATGVASRSSSEPAVTRPPAPAPPRTPPPAPTPQEPATESFGVGDVLAYLGHLVVAFALGVLLLLVVAGAATLVTGGDFSILETRGLPVFIGVASSIAIFAFLRGRRRPAGAHDWVMAGIGFLALVVAGAMLYRPVVMEDVQVSLERALGLWSDADAAAVDGFESEVLSWNETTTVYQRLVAGVLSGDADVESFRTPATVTEEALEERISGMRAEAASAENDDLSDALDRLTEAYAEQLQGLRLVTSGILGSNFADLERGDAAFKSARGVADVVFEERVRPLLERAGVDAGSLDRAISA